MPKPNQYEQFEEILENFLKRESIMLAGEGRKFSRLLPIAFGLRGMPRASFKEYLRAELERRKPMSSTAIPVAEIRATASPRLTFKDAAKAIEFYKRAFGARETFRFEVGGGVAHAAIAIGDSSLFLAEEWPDGGRFSAETLGNSPVWLTIRVGDVDAFAKTAISAGMKVKRPIQDQFYGHRDVLLGDPFGYTWNVYTVTEEMSVEEMHRRMEREAVESGTSEAESRDADRKGAVPYIREGFHTVTPYILVGGAAKFIDFLVQAFGAQERGRVPVPGGKIMHAEVKLGDSMIEMSDGNEQYEPSPVTIHLTVPDAEEAYRKARRAGAISLYEPRMQFYGEYEAGVRDPFGNEWYITPPTKEYPHPTVQPYLHLHDAEKMISFLEAAFGGRAEGVHKWPGGAIAHATVLIGDGEIEIDEAFRANRQTQCHLHLYVPDTDTVYAQALRAGATSLEAPNDKPYGDRSAGVKDPWGNSWFIATHIKDVAF